MSTDRSATRVGEDGWISRGSHAYRRLCVALLIAGFATFALLYSAQPLLPQFASLYGVGAAQASLAVSFATGAMALAFLPVSFLSDRVGRLPVMATSLFASAGLTLLSAAAPGWHALLAARALTGVALAGVPAIAMTYVGEECDRATLGSAMGLYIAGSAIGGMAGRLGVTAIAEAFGWRSAMGGLGALGLLGAAVFVIAAPRSRGFAPQRHSLASVRAAAGRLARDRVTPWLFLEGFVLMGAFVTVYNYMGFRLQAPPYRLSQSQVGLIFLTYIVGSITSARVGGWGGRVGPNKVLWAPICVLAAGLALTMASPLPVIVAGVGVVTGAFFGAHSVASGWIGRRTGRDKALASSLYLLFYYGGSSLLGSLGGVAWTYGGWGAVGLFAGGLTAVGLLVALSLSKARPACEPASVAVSGG